jgi:hypothetical protein
MKNRAKCKLCNQILESFHTYDYVTCKCGEISISGGNDKLECSAKNWENFLRVDDEGNEVVIKVKDSQLPSDNSDFVEIPGKVTRKEMIEMFEAMVKNIENLPTGAMSQPINHYDMFSFMAIILAILKAKKNS